MVKCVVGHLFTFNLLLVVPYILLKIAYKEDVQDYILNDVG